MGMSRGGVGGGAGLAGVLLAAQVLPPIQAAAFLLPILVPDLSFLNTINDNEMNNLSYQLISSGILKRGGICLLFAAIIGIASKTSSKINLLIFQIPIIMIVVGQNLFLIIKRISKIF